MKESVEESKGKVKKKRGAVGELQRKSGMDEEREKVL